LLNRVYSCSMPNQGLCDAAASMAFLQW
jgi:hypothetical protein